MKQKTLATLFFLCFVFCSSIGQGREAGWDTVGIRAGADFTDSHSGVENFQLYEAFANYLLPGKWGGAPGLELRTRLDGSAGALKRRDKAGFIGTVGPSLALGMLGDRVEWDAGASVAYLSRYHFPYRNLGGPVQFVLHSGLGVYPLRNLGLAYRFEHISNSDLYGHNPGLNLHILELKYRF